MKNDVGDERQVVGRASGQEVRRGFDMHDFEVRRDKNVIQPPHRQERGKRSAGDVRERMGLHIAKGRHSMSVLPR
ncbi:MAG TPA: hypothetical protein VHF69_13670, partial [Candidatus Synoicihabitans sp.]|nr:hypothetical protein [Candidatus Synoicihabitans sp.]